MIGSGSISDYVWVAGGTLLTLVLALALLFWIDQEWSALDRKRGEPAASDIAPGQREAPTQPDDGAAPGE